MDTSARPWWISGIAGLFFVITSFVASAINVQIDLGTVTRRAGVKERP